MWCLAFFPLVCLCRLPDNDGWLVFWVCVWGGRRQEVSPSWCPGRDATRAHYTSCLGPNGFPGIATEIQVLTPTPGLFDSALFLSCFYLFNISPTLPINTACSSRQNNKDFVFFFYWTACAFCVSLFLPYWGFALLHLFVQYVWIMRLWLNVKPLNVALELIR